MNYRFFQNKYCEFYPCHNLEKINCLFCFCPLYHIKECGGNFILLKNNIKSCIKCNFPHKEENYYLVVSKLKGENHGMEMGTEYK